jgi:[acyl-carrier-protein] S-malonyltransferase
MYAFVFPGQGSQFVGMGHDLYKTFPASREVFQEIDDALNQKLSNLIFSGPDSDLTLTENAQPGIMAVSVAAFKALEHEYGYALLDKAAVMAGHSLGEYSAVIASGGMHIMDGAQILKLRGRSMQDAVPLGVGGMAAILGVTLEQAEAIAAAASNGNDMECSVANDNSPGQIVVSGHAGAVEKVIEIAKDFGASRAIMLQVSAPFHSKLMEPAEHIMSKALSETVIKNLPVPLIANVSAKIIQEADDVRQSLIQQVTGRVRWRESIDQLKSIGVRRVVEIGPGKVLSGLVKRIDPHLEVFSIASPKDIDEFLKVF